MLSFSSSFLSLRNQWLNNSLTANFLAEYWSTFSRSPNALGCHPSNYSKEIVSYVVNEMLDNAVKYGCASADDTTQVAIRLTLASEHLRVYVTNRSPAKSWKSLQEYIHVLLTEDHERLYFRQMEENAVSGKQSVSRLGLLSITHDYHGQIAWKFTAWPLNSKDRIIITMVQVPITFSQTVENMKQRRIHA